MYGVLVVVVSVCVLAGLMGWSVHREKQWKHMVFNGSTDSVLAHMYSLGVANIISPAGGGTLLTF